jgi:hypothetical protein
MSRARLRPMNTLAGPAHAGWAWLTHAAFVLVLAVVIARLLTIDVVRDVGFPVPGGGDAVHGPGPGTGLAFDLVAALPALLVLARRALDRDYRLAPRRSHLLLLGLTVWMAASVAWSSDRFTAVVSTAHFASGACLLWAASQLVRSWDRLRVVAAVSLGLLVSLVIHTGVYRFVDVANTRQFWAEPKNREQFLREHNWASDSFEARQFEQKLTTGEQSAFFDSANTLAAVGVLLLFASAGLGLQRAVDDRDPRWLALAAVTVAAGGWVLLVARSKTAVATPVVGVGVLLLCWRFGPALRRRPTAAYAAAVATVVLALLAVVGHGLAHHGLFPGHFSNSLDFRWKYWTASAGVFAQHPLLGVGWANFGQHYLAHRLPDAAEEIKDPHNFLVRFATELGSVGLILAVGWLLRLAWELTRPAPATPAAGRPAARPVHVAVVAWAACLGIGMSALATVDFSANILDSLILLLQPLLLLLAIVLCGIAGSMRSPDQWSADARPAPWVFATLTVGLGLFLLHNLIDFGWFEPGAACAFMTLAGAALGICPAPVTTAVAHRGRAIGTLSVAVAVWLAVALGVAVPIGLASEGATAADDLIRSAPPDRPADVAAAYRRATDGYAAASALVPYDADLLARAARAAAYGGDGARARLLVAEAERVDPRLIDARLLDADLRPPGDGAGTRAAYDAAVALNPNDRDIRLRYAQALDRLGDRSAAAAQYRAALAADAALPVGEPRRFKPQQLAQYQALALP